MSVGRFIRRVSKAAETVQITEEKPPRIGDRTVGYA
jgi:hypothetical protein